VLSVVRKPWFKRVAFGVASAAIVAVTFAYLLPAIADYGDVWGVVKQLSWASVAALLGATAINVATFAPPWQVALPGLSFVQALSVTQASTALSIVLPGGAAVGAAGSFGILRGWGFAIRDVTRAVTLTGLWNQFLNLSYPIVAVFLLTISGASTAALATVAFVGVAILGLAVGGFVLILVSDRLATDIGDVAARCASWFRGKLRRPPVTWTGAAFERFRAEAGDFLERRWHLLTLSSMAGSLAVFGLLLVCLRTLDVPSSSVTAVEAFASWALVRIRVVELGLTGALVGFGGAKANVVAAVLVFRFLTTVPTLLIGLAAAFTWRRQRRRVSDAPRQAGSSGSDDAPGVSASGHSTGRLAP
jgi:uncharacterized membrane protein YbhN (UPF0104 family)